MSLWPILAVLDEAQRREVLAAARRRRFKRGEVIFHEGDPGDSIHLVAKGQIGVRIHTPLGDVAMVRVLGPGEFFGELAVIAPGPRHATATCLTAVETLVLTGQQLKDLQDAHPSVANVVTDALAHEIRRLSSQLVETIYLPTDRRVWRRLLNLAAVFGEEGAPATTVPLTQEELAQVVGCTRPTVNQVLREGESQGWIALGRGRIELIDLDAIQRRAR